MKTKVVIVIVILAVFVLLSMARKAVHLGTAVTATPPKVEASHKDGAADALELSIAFRNVTKDFHVTEIQMPKDLFVAIDGTTPKGFKAEPFMSAQGDVEPAQLNEKYIRWVGKVRGRPNDPVILRIPAKAPGQGAGVVQVSYKGEDDSTGSANIYVRVAPPPPPRPPHR